MQPSSCSSSAGWSLLWLAMQSAGFGSMQRGSELRTSLPSLWSRFKPGLAWSALSQHLSRGFVSKVVHRATPRASLGTGLRVCSFTRLQSGSSPCCTPLLPRRSLQLGGAIRLRGLQTLVQQGRPALKLPHPRQTRPVPPPPVKPKEMGLDWAVGRVDVASNPMPKGGVGSQRICASCLHSSHYLSIRRGRAASARQRT